MISDKAMREVLDGAQKAEDEGPCWCTDEDCEYDHEEPDQFPTYCITFVTPNGSLDKADNKHCLGKKWGIDGPLEFVLDHPQSFPEDADRMVVIERATGSWVAATAYLG